MTTEYSDLSEAEQNALVHVCIRAGLADGTLSESERSEIKRVAENLSNEGHNLTLRYQQALAGNASLSSLTQELQSEKARALAYEMAVCICQVDQALSPPEEQYLNDLRDTLNLDVRSAADFRNSAALLREEPPIIGHASPAATQLDEMIRDRAILTGALELLPQRLATMAIIPVQMRLVYHIGKTYGYELDMGHTKEFFATVGVGLTSQIVEGFLSRLVQGVTHRIAGRLAGAVASQATESAMAFATTYALGQAAKTYYQSGRTLSREQLREQFSKWVSDGRTQQLRLTDQISQRASTLNLGQFLPMLKSQ